MRFLTLALVTISALPSAGMAQDKAPIDPARIAWARPDAKPAWRKIAWRTTLGEAIVEASRDKKPILLWAMNGHPLGCT